MSENSLELSLGQKLIIIGNVLGSLSMALVAIGSAIRKNGVENEPMFSMGGSEKAAPRFMHANQRGNYWGEANENR